MSSPRQTLTRPPAGRSSPLANCLLGLLALFTLAGGLQQLLGMSVVFVLASLTAYLVGTTVLLASLPRRPALACFGAANQVTLVRAALVALLFGLFDDDGITLVSSQDPTTWSMSARGSWNTGSTKGITVRTLSMIRS